MIPKAEQVISHDADSTAVVANLGSLSDGSKGPTRNQHHDGTEVSQRIGSVEDGNTSLDANDGDNDFDDDQRFDSDDSFTPAFKLPSGEKILHQDTSSLQQAVMVHDFM